KEDSVVSPHAIPEISKNGDFVYTDLLKHYNFITTASVLFRKPEDFVFPLWFFKVPFGDMGLYYIVSSGKKIRCLTDTMSVYRIHSQGIFHGKSNIQQKKQHLQFHRLLYPSLQAEEKVISKKKMQQYVKEIA